MCSKPRDLRARPQGSNSEPALDATRSLARVCRQQPTSHEDEKKTAVQVGTVQLKALAVLMRADVRLMETVVKEQRAKAT
jgi:hypothetical protein